jgi:hypothetical protein
MPTQNLSGGETVKKATTNRKPRAYLERIKMRIRKTAEFRKALAEQARKIDVRLS